MPRVKVLTLALLAGLLPVVALAQTTTAPGIDVEVYNPLTGSNSFCVAPGGSFTANVLVRPGTAASTCTLACSPPAAAGGTANLATAAVDLLFDPAVLGFVTAANNQATAAVDGLLQTQNLAQGRLGWALGGDWTPDATVGGTLASPCAMGKLTAAGFVFSATFTGLVPGTTTLTLAQQPGFELSFGDVCGGSFEPASGVDEVRGASVLVDAACASIIFADGFNTGTTGAWSVVAP